MIGKEEHVANNFTRMFLRETSVLCFRLTVTCTCYINYLIKMQIANLVSTTSFWKNISRSAKSQKIG